MILRAKRPVLLKAVYTLDIIPVPKSFAKMPSSHSIGRTIHRPHKIIVDHALIEPTANLDLWIFSRRLSLNKDMKVHKRLEMSDISPCLHLIATMGESGESGPRDHEVQL